MSDHRHDAEQQPPVDPSGIDEPHDVLAAEEFGIGTRDERVPPDPTGIHEPHDVLAAEEFAMPSPVDHADAGSGGRGARAWVPFAALALGAVVLLRRRRS
jgi:hypothetical protein